MNSWLPDTGLGSARVLVLTDCDEHTMDPDGELSLRDHAIVLRPDERELLTSPDNAIARVLRSHAIERIVVLGRIPHRPRAGEFLEPAQNTATIRAFCRRAGVVASLVERHAAGRLATAQFRAQLDTLVRLANLEACAEVQRALDRGDLELVAVTYDASSGQLEVFDGARFCRLERSRFLHLLDGDGLRRRGAPSVPVVASDSAPVRGELTGGLA